MKKNQLITVLLAIVLIAATVLIVLQFASPETRGRLYGWTGDAAPLDQPAAPSR